MDNGNTFQDEKHGLHSALEFRNDYNLQGLNRIITMMSQLKKAHEKEVQMLSHKQLNTKQVIQLWQKIVNWRVSQKL